MMVLNGTLCYRPWKMQGKILLSSNECSVYIRYRWGEGESRRPIMGYKAVNVSSTGWINVFSFTNWIN